MEPIRVSAEVGGRTLTLETGRLARQATGSVLVTYGETTVLGTVVISKNPKEGVDFLPLKVDYDEKFYASGKIKGSRFIKREGRPADEAILTARAIDRAIRPLFPKDFHHEMQLILTVLSFDGVNSPDMVGAIAASACLALSGAPVVGDIAMSRVGRANGNFIFNPTHEEQLLSDMEVIVASLEDRMIMLEAGANEVPEEDMFGAIEFAVAQNQVILKLISDLTSQAGKSKMIVEEVSYDKDLYAQVKELTNASIEYIYGKLGKQEREEFINNLKKEIVEKLTQGVDDAEKGKKSSELAELFEKVLKSVIRDNILNRERRVGGRGLDEIRPISISTLVLPRVHGSALFQRGETQALTITTLGGPGEAQTIDNMEEETTKRYMHHYNFPPFSVGDINTRRMTGNREIGHGNLAEKALLPVLPPKETFPYTIRVVSEIFESNGSSSMAACCGSTLSLMDAGVPIIRPVAGVAMGLMIDKESGNYKVLTDLQDIEDFGGDMDFKVAGTEKGVTAIQVDMKVHGLKMDIVKDALSKARAGRGVIMKAMTDVISTPKAELSKYAPRIISFKVNPELIRFIIGKGGETINKITAETGVLIDIEQDGIVSITSNDAEMSKKAEDWIKMLTKEIKVGEVYDAKVTRIADFGAFVELVPGTDALCHISELARERVNRVEDVVSVGQIIKVKVIKIDESGKIAASHKATLVEA